MRDLWTVAFAGGGTGGHLYPALALAGELVSQRPEIRPVFIGASRGIESRVLPEKGLEYSLLPVRGWKRGQFRTNIGVPWALLKSLFSSIKLHKRYNTKLVVVTGGYSSAPAGLAAVIPAVYFYNHLTNRVKLFLSAMDDFSLEFLGIAERNFT